MFPSGEFFRCLRNDPSLVPLITVLIPFPGARAGAFNPQADLSTRGLTGDTPGIAPEARVTMRLPQTRRSIPLAPAINSPSVCAIGAQIESNKFCQYLDPFLPASSR